MSVYRIIKIFIYISFLLSINCIFLSCNKSTNTQTQAPLNKKVLNDDRSSNIAISILTTLNKDSVEIFSKHYIYDTVAGKQVGFMEFLNKQISLEYTNYNYFGNEITYFVSNYSSEREDLLAIKWYKFKTVYKDAGLSKILSFVIHDYNGYEVSKSDYKYDNENKQTGYTYYYGNKLLSEDKDFVYNGNECNYNNIIYIYSDSTVSNRITKNKIIYYGSNFDKKISHITYDNENNEITRQDYKYDSQGRKIGFSDYYKGELLKEEKEYVYNEKNYSFNTYEYINGAANNLFINKFTHY